MCFMSDTIHITHVLYSTFLYSKMIIIDRIICKVYCIYIELSEVDVAVL